MTDTNKPGPGVYALTFNVGALKLFECIRNELLMHEPDIGEDRAAYIAEQTLRRIERDTR